MDLKLVIIGGVAGGMSAATRARRMNESASIVVLEKSGHISFANCGLPYFIGGQIEREESLYLTTPQRVARRYRIDARVRHEVTRIDRQARYIEGTCRQTGRDFRLPFDKLILAPGAAPIVPPLPGTDAQNVFVLRNVEDTLRMQQFIRDAQPRRAVVVGAGFIGLEMVEALHARGIEVTVIEKAPQVLPALDIELAGEVEEELWQHDVTVLTGAGLDALDVQQGRAVAVVTDQGQRCETGLVLLSMGVRPSVQLALDAGLVIGPSGGIAVDQWLRTSDLDIYAVGDAAEVTHGVTELVTRIPLAGSANRHGRLAGEHAVTGHARSAATVLGTAVVRVFALDVALTGLGHAAARKLGYDADTAVIYPDNHASYYPGAQRMHLQLVYDRTNGRVLGAQAVGRGGVDKRIDVIATLLHFHGTIDDLSELDLCYAPQFSTAKDPVHYGAFVAQNQRANLSPGVSEWRGVEQLVDVRSTAEFASGSLPGAINIPIDELRARYQELDPGKTTVVYCEVGTRAHLATRLLKQIGFERVCNLKGGYVQARAGLD
jgi:NADPH-dependent 2,4-dienoyl-CoA reductase/sulfur reductase-like enzyme/rhodanese-related sulfurtransferase